MSITTPVAIPEVTVFGYVYIYENGGQVAVENATVYFQAPPYLAYDNHITIDRQVQTDNEGRYQIVLPETTTTGTIVQVTVQDADGFQLIEQRKAILVPDSGGPYSVQDILAEPQADAVITQGPQGPPGPAGPQGPQGLPGSAVPTFQIAGTQSVSNPGTYIVDASGGATIITIPDASDVDPTDGTNIYTIFKKDSSAFTVTVRTTSSQQIGQATSQVISNQDQGFSCNDVTTRYEITGDSRRDFGSPVTIGTANADGTAVTVARADHVHDHGAQTDPTLHAAAIAGGNAGFMTGADKTKLDGIEAGAQVNVFGEVLLNGGIANVGGNSTMTATFGHNAADADMRIPYDGEIIALSAVINNSRTTGTCTVAARINGVAQTGPGETTVIDGTNPDHNDVVIATPIQFNAGDRLIIESVTSGFAPSGGDLTVALIWRRR